VFIRIPVYTPDRTFGKRYNVTLELDLSRESEGMYLLLLEDNMGNGCTFRLVKE
jgi:hypothetical protein